VVADLCDEKGACLTLPSSDRSDRDIEVNFNFDSLLLLSLLYNRQLEAHTGPSPMGNLTSQEEGVVETPGQSSTAEQ